jgi:hypothetical protein
MVVTPLPLVSVSGIAEVFDRSIVTGCGRDMTTSDGVGDSMLELVTMGFVSSEREMSVLDHLDVFQ